MKNITFFIERLSGGGAERVTALLAGQLCSKYNVSIIVRRKSENEYRINKEVNIVYLPGKCSGGRNAAVHIINAFYNIVELRRIIRKLKTDVLISLAQPGTFRGLCNSIFFDNVKLILSERNTPSIFPKEESLRRIRLKAFRRADAVVFQTDDAKAYFEESIQKKGRVIANPINNNLPEPYHGKRKKVIVNFCRMESQKNLYMLIDAFVCLWKEHSDYKLELYGEGSLKNELIEYAVRSECGSSIEFYPFVNNIHERILDYSMYAMSSDYEGISNSMLEAMAIGLPVVATDCPVGGSKMAIRSYDNGILIPVGDTVAMYRAMKDIIEKEELSKKLSANAPQIRIAWGIEKITDMWINVIEEVLKK